MTEQEERCPTCGSDDPAKDYMVGWKREWWPHDDKRCDDPFHATDSWKARALTAESRVQELEGERDELNDACRELQERNMMEACDECNDREEAAIARAEAAESRLARLEEALKERARVAHDALKFASSDHHGRFADCTAIPCEQARSLLTHPTPPRSDG